MVWTGTPFEFCTTLFVSPKILGFWVTMVVGWADSQQAGHATGLPKLRDQSAGKIEETDFNKLRSKSGELRRARLHQWQADGAAIHTKHRHQCFRGR